MNKHSSFTPENPDYKQRVMDSFAAQQAMQTLGAALQSIEPGKLSIALPYQPKLTQQHGFLHAGIVTTVLDSACGYAAFTLMPANAEVLSVEFKINLLAPAKGERLIATGQVLKAGRNLTICQGEAVMLSGTDTKTVAHMVGTMMSIRNREDLTANIGLTRSK